MTAPSPATSCPACGASASGKFCSACGASLEPRSCVRCRAALGAQARFCHRCGQPVGAGVAGERSDRSAWIVAGTLSALLVGVIVYNVVTQEPAPRIPDMANAGAAAGDTTARAGGAPDISQLTPRERFDRLFNRIMQAADQGDTAQVRRFTPMALGAYAQLDTIDVDARYHAAVIRLQTGDIAGAHALADTILEQSPDHLFGYIVRGTAATLADDPGARSQAEREFLRRYDREMAAERPEYRDHAPVIEEFKRGAEAVGRSGGQADRKP
jgi:Double zinc ribbon